MAADGILGKSKSQYTLKHIEQQQVQVEAVIELDELNSLVAKAIEDKTSDLNTELERLKAKVAELQSEAGSGGLERAAADAALEAEAAALEAKAAAELRAEQAEAKAAELEKRVGELEGKVVNAEAEVEAVKADAPPPDEVTEEDHSRAKRLASALLEDVVGEDEDKAKKALTEGTFRDEFSDELDDAKNAYRRRVKAEVRSEKDHWEEVLAALEAEHKS